MKIIVFGGDGFCGWPASLYLSNRGHEIIIVDNLSRRKIDVELGYDSLTPIQTIFIRLDTWKSIKRKSIEFFNIDIANQYEQILELILDKKPDAILHYAEQRAAPYSMKSPQHKQYTLENNLKGTHNLLCAIAESNLDIHFAHLGSMGVYGYFSRRSRIHEGYLDAIIPKEKSDVKTRLLWPGIPASMYHVTKMQDALLFQFYNLNDGLRITDLHQGVVWGTNTDETVLDERLINRFDYDGDYGTFINRFLMQAVIGLPLTVYGKGGQCRPIIHIKDSVRCVELALLHPPDKGDVVDIYNQMTEIFQIRDVAKIISEKTGAKIEFVENPRVEEEEVQLDAENDKFLSLGLNPLKLSDQLMDEVMEIVEKYKHRCILSSILPSSKWRK